MKATLVPEFVLMLAVFAAVAFAPTLVALVVAVLVLAFVWRRHVVWERRRS